MSAQIQQNIGSVALIVDNYDHAINFYTQKLQFTLVEDLDLGEGNRWVQVAPPNSNGTCLVFIKASTDRQKQVIGNQAGGHVILFLHTNDFWRDYKQMKTNGVVFEEEPRVEAYGTVAVFQDLYGNRWDFIERNNIDDSAL